MAEPEARRPGCGAMVGWLLLTLVESIVAGLGVTLAILGVADSSFLLGGLGLFLVTAMVTALGVGHSRAGSRPRPGIWTQATVFFVGMIVSAGWLLNLATSGNRVSPERLVASNLKEIATAEADFRGNDRDGNKINDFWTGDVAGLYLIRNADPLLPPGPIKQIPLKVAEADAAPIPPGGAGGLISPLPEGFHPRQPREGYFFQAMTEDSEERLQQVTDEKSGPVHHTSKFAFCAFPEKPGRVTFIVNEDNTVWKKDTQGKPVTRWPKDPPAEGWSKLD